MCAARSGYRPDMSNNTPEPLEPLDDSPDTANEENDDSEQDIEGRYPDADPETDVRDPEGGQPRTAIRPPQSG